MTNSPIRCPEGRLGVRYLDGDTTRVASYCFECSLLKPEQRCAETRQESGVVTAVALPAEPAVEPAAVVASS